MPARVVVGEAPTTMQFLTVLLVAPFGAVVLAIHITEAAVLGLPLVIVKLRSVPPLENHMGRPSFRPTKLFAKESRWYIKRWLVRSAWKMVLEAENVGEDISRIPLSLNLMAIADKDG